MMAFRINRVSTISVMVPDLVGQEFELGGAWPVSYLGLALSVFPLDLLEENQVCLGSPNEVPDRPQDELPVEGGKTLVNIPGQDSDSHPYLVPRCSLRNEIFTLTSGPGFAILPAHDLRGLVSK